MKNKGTGRISVSRLIKFSVFALLAVYAAVTLAAQQNEIKRCNQLMAEYDRKIKQQNELAEKLKQEKENQNSDQFYEQTARDKLGFVKDNERIFIDGSGR